MVEAGTGTGKTYAYLAPALRAKKVIISTGSKALQDQLYSRDLPTVAKALKFTGKLALLKGVPTTCVSNVLSSRRWRAAICRCKPSAM